MLCFVNKIAVLFLYLHSFFVFFATCTLSHVWREANKVAEIWVVKEVRIHGCLSLHDDQLIS
jgi:hypothetical protein